MASSKVIDINTATREELTKIVGIGKARAAVIMEERDRKGQLTLTDLKLLENVPNTIWDPLIRSGEIIVEIKETQQENLTPEQKIKELEDRVSSMNKKVQEKVHLLAEKQASMDNLEKQMTLIREELDHRLLEQQTKFEKLIVRMDEDNNSQMETMAKEAEHKEQLLREDIHARDEQIRQMEEIKKSTERIDRVTSSGIYTKQRDYTMFDDLLSDRKPNMTRIDFKSDFSRPKADRALDSKSDDKSSKQPDRNVRKEPLPPKMATYDGRSDWRPYFLQFSHIANRYKWTPEQRLDKLIECLRDKALKFYSVKAKSVQEDYMQLCTKINERFGRRDLPHIIRRQLQELKQQVEESLEEYAERTQEMAIDGYPETPEEFVEIVAVDAFLQGCSEKKAALTAMDKNPTTLHYALQYVKSAATNQRIILGSKKVDLKRVTFDEDVEEYSPGVEPAVRAVSFPDNNLNLSKLDQRLRKTEEGLEETRNMVREIFNVVTANRPKSPTRTGFSSPVKKTPGECFSCGRPGHFSRECPNRVRSYSPNGNRSRSPSPSRQLNWNGLKM